MGTNAHLTVPPAGRVIDLSLPLRPGMPVYPGDPEMEVEKLGDGHCVLHRLTLGTHLGTHIDAPAHILPGGAGVDAVPLDACIGPARVVDCTGLTEIGERDLQERAPDASPGGRLLLRTDWDRTFGEPRYYEDFPGLAPDAVRWLVGRRIALLGLETPSISTTNDHEAHAALLGAGVVIVEGLANLARIPAETCWFAALPLALAGLDGSPVRAVAFTT